MRNWLRPSVLTTWITWNKILGPPVAFQAQDCDNLLVVFSSWRFLLPIFLSAVDDYGAVTSKGALLRFLLRPPFWNYSSSHSPRVINLKPIAPAYVAFLYLCHKCEHSYAYPYVYAYAYVTRVNQPEDWKLAWTRDRYELSNYDVKYVCMSAKKWVILPAIICLRPQALKVRN